MNTNELGRTLKQVFENYNFPADDMALRNQNMQKPFMSENNQSKFSNTQTNFTGGFSKQSLRKSSLNKMGQNQTVAAFNDL